ncbi:hypothetical protein [Streptomyces vilmorinianum]|uniref:hypothetical protein n=1 Tax=Streptomyces vilmorinianum TaxID=3051092 RepID=UPI0010FB8FC0|nr:hypothetical protein [Streptomyces vilmorinianum]
MRTNRVLLAAAASVVMFTLAGCGSDDGGSKIPTAGDGTTSSSKGAGSGSGSGGGGGSEQDEVAAYVDAQRKWVACMRENGIDLPDPDDKGQIDIGEDRRAQKSDPKFVQAQDKCRGLVVSVPASVEKLLRPKLSAEQIKVRRDYADCMQKNGAADFPDPGPEGYAENDVQWDQSSAGAKRAARTCAPIIGDPVDQGPGKG